MGGKQRRRERNGADNIQVGKVCGGERRGCLMCPRSHLGTLSNITASLFPTSGSTGDGVAPRCNANDVRGGQVWGSNWVGPEMPTPQKLLGQVSAHHDC